MADPEICTINEWYFYSEYKIKTLVKRIVEVSSNRIKPDSYDKVQRILGGPEEYLGEIRFFSKAIQTQK